MQTISSGEIDYLAASFRAWCKANAVTTPDADAAQAYFAYVRENEPYAAELIDDDWEDFIAFLTERRLLGS